MHLFVIMGVSGCGKSTVAALVTERLKAAGENATMIEADDLHGEANILKMQSGEPLTDEDRWPWLMRVAEAMKTSSAPVIVSCSALKRAYRQCLLDNTGESIGFIHLHTNSEIIIQRMADREDHFMPLSLLHSQLQTLEPLEPDEVGAIIDIDQSIEDVTDDALQTVQALSIHGCL